MSSLTSRFQWNLDDLKLIGIHKEIKPKETPKKKKRESFRMLDSEVKKED